jgi:hypothetical protein
MSGVQRHGDPVLERTGEGLQIGSVRGEDPLQCGKVRIRYDGRVGADLERTVRVRRINHEDGGLGTGQQILELLTDSGQRGHDIPTFNDHPYGCYLWVAGRADGCEGYGDGRLEQVEVG